MYSGRLGARSPGPPGTRSSLSRAPRTRRGAARRCLLTATAAAARPRDAVQRGFDLTEFDAEPADLHLVVGPTEVTQSAVGLPPHQVPGAVHPRAGAPNGHATNRSAVRAGTAQVSPRQSRAGEVELPGHARRHRFECGVEDVGPGVADRSSDRVLRPCPRRFRPCPRWTRPWSRSARTVHHRRGGGARCRRPASGAAPRRRSTRSPMRTPNAGPRPAPRDRRGPPDDVTRAGHPRGRPPGPASRRPPTTRPPRTVARTARTRRCRTRRGDRSTRLAA